MLNNEEVVVNNDKLQLSGSIEGSKRWQRLYNKLDNWRRNWFTMLNNRPY